MSAALVLLVVGLVLIVLATIESARTHRIDLQSRIWLMTGAILWAVCAWVWPRS